MPATSSDESVALYIFLKSDTYNTSSVFLRLSSIYICFLYVCWFTSDKVFKNGPGKIYGKQPFKFWGDMVCYHFKYFRGCIPEVLHGPFFSNLFHMM